MVRRHGPPATPWHLPILFALVFACLASASAVNQTIDDTLGDSVSGAKVQYLPAASGSQAQVWTNSTGCATCADVPNPSLSFDKTWTAALYVPSLVSISANMRFSGNAIYVFLILPNFAPNLDLESTVACDFVIDGAVVGSFSHVSDGSGDFTYNALVYQNTTISDGDHTFSIRASGPDPAVIIFDHVVYTVGTPDPTTSSPPVSTDTPAAPPINTVASVDSDTDSPTTSSAQPVLPSSTAGSTDGFPAFPTAPDSATLSPGPTASTPPNPFYMTSSYPPPSASPSAGAGLVPALPSTGNSERVGHIIAIAGGAVGGVVVVVFFLVFFMLWRRRRARERQLRASGTVSVFDLLDRTPPPSPPPMRARVLGPASGGMTHSGASMSEGGSPRMGGARPLPMPPSGRNDWQTRTFESTSTSEVDLARPPAFGPGYGRVIGATQTKSPTASASASAGHGAGPMSPSPYLLASSTGHGHAHSAQSSLSVSAYSSDAHAGLHIHIPPSAFAPGTASPLTSTSSHAPTPVPLMRGGAPLPPAQGARVQAIVLNALAAHERGGSISVDMRRAVQGDRRASTSSAATDVDVRLDGASEEEMEELDLEPELWGKPMVHVDSGIRIRSALLELPPDYSPA